MPLRIRQDSIAGQFLMYLYAAEELVTATVTYYPRSFKIPSSERHLSSERSAVYRLIKSGLIEIIESEDQKCYKLTPKGQIQALILKTKMPTKTKWDGKWRMAIFDIPENCSNERDQLRRLLLINNFSKLQASVYVSPYQINREAIDYLKKTGLIKYIHFARIDELDDDKELRKKFDL